MINNYNFVVFLTVLVNFATEVRALRLNLKLILISFLRGKVTRCYHYKKYMYYRLEAGIKLSIDVI